MKIDLDNITLFQNIAKGTDTDIHVVRAYLSDNMEMSGGVITEDAAWSYIKTLLNKPVEYESRIEGTPKHFAGVVFEELDRNIHIVPHFTVPIHWSFYEGLDPCEGKPVAWGFFAVNNDEYELTNHRTVNKIYWIDYLKLEGLPISDIVREVNKKRADIGYKRPVWCVIDHKYGNRTMQGGEEQTTWLSKLVEYDTGINYVQSSSKQGSIEIGESIVKEYLKLKYNQLKDKKEPVLQVFDTCEHRDDPFCPISHLFNYSRDEDKPSKRTEEYKDFVDILRYVLERYPRYWDKSSEAAYPKKKSYFQRAA
jgi:hypothetical protein